MFVFFLSLCLHFFDNKSNESDTWNEIRSRKHDKEDLQKVYSTVTQNNSQHYAYYQFII